MKGEVLTIDLKNRTFKDSIILDVSPIKGNEPMVLNFDIKTSLERVKNSLRDGNIEKSEKELSTIAPYLETHKNHELFNEYYICDVVSFNLNQVMMGIKKEKGGLDNFLMLRGIYYYLVTFKVSNDISYFEDTYTKYLNEVGEYIRSYNLINMLSEFKANINNEDKTSYIMYMIDKLEDIYLYDEEERNILEELKVCIENLRSENLQYYNDNENRKGVIKMLMPYEYREVFKDKSFESYKVILKESYENYKELNHDFQIIHILHTLNKCQDYYSYHNIIINLPLRELIMLSDYARQYIVRKLFEKNKKYYTIMDLEKDISAFIKKLNMKKNTNVIPL